MRWKRPTCDLTKGETDAFGLLSRAAREKIWGASPKMVQTPTGVSYLRVATRRTRRCSAGCRLPRRVPEPLADGARSARENLERAAQNDANVSLISTESLSRGFPRLRRDSPHLRRDPPPPPAAAASGGFPPFGGNCLSEIATGRAASLSSSRDSTRGVRVDACLAAPSARRSAPPKKRRLEESGFHGACLRPPAAVASREAARGGGLTRRARPAASPASGAGGRRRCASRRSCS